MKKVFIALLALGAAFATVPLWGSCDLNADACSAWCRMKHFNSDSKTFGCRVSCSMEQASCRSRDAAGGFNEFMKGLQEK